MTRPKHIPAKPVGRPLKSRELAGYDNDLAHLGKLRIACMTDKRLSMEEYMKISDSIRAIEKVLRRLPKPVSA